MRMRWVILFLAVGGAGGALTGWVRALATQAVSARAHQDAARAAACIAEFDALQPKGSGFTFGSPDLEAFRASCALALELWNLAPEHPELPRLLDMRFALLVNTFQDYATARAETERLLASHPDGPLHLLALRHQAWIALQDPATLPEQAFARAEAAFAADAASPPAAASFRELLARRATADPDRQRALAQAVVDAHAGDDGAESGAREILRILGRFGTRPELHARDVLRDGDVDLESLRGHPVVLHVSTFDWEEYYGADQSAEVEALRRLRAERPDVAVVTLHETPDRERRAGVLARARALDVTWPLVFDGEADVPPERAVAELETHLSWTLGLRSAPWFLLLDREGAVRAACTRLAPLLERLDR